MEGPIKKLSPAQIRALRKANERAEPLTPADVLAFLQGQKTTRQNFAVVVSGKAYLVIEARSRKALFAELANHAEKPPALIL